MIKKPFLLTQGEIMPNRELFENSFKSTIWYSKKLKDTKRIKEEFIKIAGFTDEDIYNMDKELLTSKQKNNEPKVEEDPIIIKKIENEIPFELEKELENEQTKKAEIQIGIGSEEEQILNSVITRLHEI
jgi:hypothetical protein